MFAPHLALLNLYWFVIYLFILLHYIIYYLLYIFNLLHQWIIYMLFYVIFLTIWFFFISMIIKTNWTFKQNCNDYGWTLNHKYVLLIISDCYVYYIWACFLYSYSICVVSTWWGVINAETRVVRRYLVERSDFW